MRRIPFNIDYPTELNTIIDAFKANGMDIYLVGGCVRDSILNLQPKDWDLATNANPDKVIEIANSINGLKCIDEDSRFGVIRIFFDKTRDYEVTTFRSDGEYLDNRRPDSVTFGTIEMDAARRDFTMNSMYYDTATSEIIDINGGFEDIQTRQLKFVGNSLDRMTEDSLRLLRGIRFANRFGMIFNDVGIFNFVELKGVSPERIRKEFVSTIKTSKLHLSLTLDKFISNDLILRMFGLKIKEFDTELMDFNSRFVPSVLAFLVKKSGQEINISKHFNELKYSKEEVEIVKFLDDFRYGCDDKEQYASLQKRWNNRISHIMPTNEFVAYTTKVLSTNAFNLAMAIVTTTPITVSNLREEGIELEGKALGDELNAVNTTALEIKINLWKIQQING